MTTSDDCPRDQTTRAGRRWPRRPARAHPGGLAATRVWWLRGRAWNGLRHPGTWELWHLPTAGIAWMLGAELAVAAWAVHASATATYTMTDLVRFAVLMACTAWYLVQSSEPEERRRASSRRGEHIDQTPVWVASSAVILPPAYSLAILTLVRLQRYSIARKASASFLLTTAAHAASVLTVYSVAQATPLAGWLERGELPQRPVDVLVCAASLATAGAGYFAAQTAVIALARALAWGTRTRRGLVGTTADNVAFLHALGLAAGVAIISSVSIVLTPIVMAATALRITRLAQALADAVGKAQRDRKTGLLNGETFHITATLKLLEDQAAERPTAFLMLDLDKFKTRWNDVYGHSGGDIVLAHVSQVLRSNTRDSDLVARWGGEEFAILLPATTREDALQLAERIRSAVEDMTIRGLTQLASGHADNTAHAVGPTRGCTVSIGVALTDENVSDYDALFGAADAAVYEAKRSGRNTVVTTTIGPATTVEKVERARRDKPAGSVA